MLPFKFNSFDINSIITRNLNINCLTVSRRLTEDRRLFPALCLNLYAQFRKHFSLLSLLLIVILSFCFPFPTIMPFFCHYLVHFHLSRHNNFLPRCDSTAVWAPSLNLWHLPGRRGPVGVEGWLSQLRWQATTFCAHHCLALSQTTTAAASPPPQLRRLDEETVALSKREPSPSWSCAALHMANEQLIWQTPFGF